MTKKELKRALAEINKPGTELNKQYVKWCSNRTTQLVARILQFMSTPDQTITTVPTVNGDGACTLLGYVSGRSHSAADMIALDELQQSDTAIIDDNYAEGE